MRDRSRHCDESQDLQGRHAKLNASFPGPANKQRAAFVKAVARVMRNINIAELLVLSYTSLWEQTSSFNSWMLYIFLKILLW
jgi:hypothetical protein